MRPCAARPSSSSANAKRLAPIGGVFHLAIILEDRLILKHIRSWFPPLILVSLQDILDAPLRLSMGAPGMHETTGNLLPWHHHWGRPRDVVFSVWGCLRL